jgi:hypothetical protein
MAKVMVSRMGAGVPGAIKAAIFSWGINISGASSPPGWRGIAGNPNSPAPKSKMSMKEKSFFILSLLKYQ